MTLADIVGFIGYAPLMVGTYLLTTRFKRSAWATRIVGDILLATAGILGGLWSVLLISASFAAMDTYGLWHAVKEHLFHKGMGEYASEPSMSHWDKPIGFNPDSKSSKEVIKRYDDAGRYGGGC